mmetsp:Transcript_37546/g.71955  ORF Transcript_37546/g.71955 Transcript_37546/m.71955 type:complete len:337 (+) Transcript_37546:519-1529(+)
MACFRTVVRAFLEAKCMMAGIAPSSTRCVFPLVHLLLFANPRATCDRTSTCSLYDMFTRTCRLPLACSLSRIFAFPQRLAMAPAIMRCVCESMAVCDSFTSSSRPPSSTIGCWFTSLMARLAIAPAATRSVISSVHVDSSSNSASRPPSWTMFTWFSSSAARLAITLTACKRTSRSSYLRSPKTVVRPTCSKSLDTADTASRCWFHTPAPEAGGGPAPRCPEASSHPRLLLEDNFSSPFDLLLGWLIFDLNLRKSSCSSWAAAIAAAAAVDLACASFASAVCSSSCLRSVATSPSKPEERSRSEPTAESCCSRVSASSCLSDLTSARASASTAPCA